MNEEMATDTQECAVTAIEKHSGNYENASKMLQEEMCKKYVQCERCRCRIFSRSHVEP